MASMLKKTKIELELLTDIGMLLMVEKELEAEFAKLHIGMLKQITNIWKIMIKQWINIYRIIEKKIFEKII